MLGGGGGGGRRSGACCCWGAPELSTGGGGGGGGRRSGARCCWRAPELSTAGGGGGATNGGDGVVACCWVAGAARDEISSGLPAQLPDCSGSGLLFTNVPDIGTADCNAVRDIDAAADSNAVIDIDAAADSAGAALGWLWKGVALM